MNQFNKSLREATYGCSKYVPVRYDEVCRAAANGYLEKNRWIEKIRDLSGDDVANKIKLINEISFNVPIYDFSTDQIACYIPETNDWYLEFPEEITITY